MRSCPRLAAIAFVAGVAAPCLGNQRGGRRGRGSREPSYAPPPKCPRHKSVILKAAPGGWYCRLCRDVWKKSELG